MLETKSLRFSYNQRDYMEFPDISCRKGGQMLILGESGSGKTTLLHLLAGLRRTKHGAIKVADHDLSTMNESTLDAFRGKHVGIIFQQAHFVRALTMHENLRLAQQLAGMSVDRGRIDKVLSRLGIGHRAKAKPHQLSIGEQQRASICRALINHPSVVFADEPTSALDDHHCNEVVKLIKEQASEDDITLLIVTHDNRLRKEFKEFVQLQSIRHESI